jgi:hypothetical protein
LQAQQLEQLSLNVAPYFRDCRGNCGPSWISVPQEADSRTSIMGDLPHIRRTPIGISCRWSRFRIRGRGDSLNGLPVHPTFGSKHLFIRHDSEFQLLFCHDRLCSPLAQPPQNHRKIVVGRTVFLRSSFSEQVADTLPAYRVRHRQSHFFYQPKYLSVVNGSASPFALRRFLARRAVPSHSSQWDKPDPLTVESSNTFASGLAD